MGTKHDEQTDAELEAIPKKYGPWQCAECQSSDVTVRVPVNPNDAVPDEAVLYAHRSECWCNVCDSETQLFRTVRYRENRTAREDQNPV